MTTGRINQVAGRQLSLTLLCVRARNLANRSSYLPLPHAEGGRVKDQQIAAFAQVMKGNCDRDKQRQSISQTLSSNSTSPTRDEETFTSRGR